ncbi:MAG: hypothetical protein KBA26_13905 [Candidatus Delongbacteria bacterium]|nr:hypothetical protein [Candidatus Delongbacteria bacterium]
MKKVLVSVVVVLAMMVLVACEKAPQDKIDAAKAAIQAAKDVQADVYASETMTALLTKEAELDTVLAGQQNKMFKSFKGVAEMCDSLVLLADQAKNDAAAGKEKMTADVQALMTEVEASIATAKEALKKCKSKAIDMAAQTAEADAAVAAIEGAKADLEAGSPNDGLTKVNEAKAKIEGIMAALEAAKGGK